MSSAAERLALSADHLSSSAERWAQQRQEGQWVAATNNKLRATLEATKHDAAVAISAADADAASAWWRASLARDEAEANARELDIINAQARRERAEKEAAVHSRESALATTERLSAQLAESRLEASVEATRWREECANLRAELEVTTDSERQHVKEADRVAAMASWAADAATIAAERADDALRREVQHASVSVRETLASAEERYRQREAALITTYEAASRNAHTARLEAVTLAERVGYEAERHRERHETRLSQSEAERQAAIQKASALDAHLGEVEKRFAAYKEVTERSIDERVTKLMSELSQEKTNVTVLERASEDATFKHREGMEAALKAADAAASAEARVVREAVDEQLREMRAQAAAAGAAAAAELAATHREVAHAREGSMALRTELGRLEGELHAAYDRYSSLHEDLTVQASCAEEASKRAAKELAKVEAERTAAQSGLAEAIRQAQGHASDAEAERASKRAAMAKAEAAEAELGAARAAMVRLTAAHDKDLDHERARRVAEVEEMAKTREREAMAAAGIQADLTTEVRAKELALQASSEEIDGLRRELMQMHVELGAKVPRWAGPKRAYMVASPSRAVEVITHAPTYRSRPTKGYVGSAHHHHHYSWPGSPVKHAAEGHGSTRRWPGTY